MSDTTVESEERAVAVQPFDLKLPMDVSKVELDRLEWPLGRPERLSSGNIGSMLPSDHVVLLPQKWFWYRRLSGIRAKVSMAIPEPRAWDGQHYILAQLFHKRFHRILTCDTKLNANIPNGLMIPFGTTWVPDWSTRDLAKDRNLSLIASAKRKLKGHKLRHKCVDWMRSEGIVVDVMGGGYRRFEVKADGVARYRFSVVIENSREENYFTEKLMDALLCKTVPIYWGCPNIGDYFDTEGMIVCEDMEGLRNAILTANQDVYDTLREKIDKNQLLASKYVDYFERIAQSIVASS